MTQAHPRLVHKSFVSLHRFDHSIAKIVEKTFSVVNFDRTKSLLPTYIGVEVEYEKEPENQKVIRKFFEGLRRVHQKHFVRFVTDTMWAMESSNGDIFYCHDEDKDDRCDVLWTLKVVGDKQVEVTVLKTPDNTRRELLTELENNTAKTLYHSNAGATVDTDVSLLLSALYLNTKNIRCLKHFSEDCHIFLVPTQDGESFLPAILCGMSSWDMTRRFNGIKGQLDYQKYTYPELFPTKSTLDELIDNAVVMLVENGLPGDEGFCPRVHYNNLELLFGLIDSGKAMLKTPHDLAIIHTAIDGDAVTLTVARHSIEKLMAAH